MRNLFRRSPLLVAAPLLATALFTSSVLAEPAGAATASRRISRPYRSRASRSAVRRPAVQQAPELVDLSERRDLPRTWRTLGYPGLPHEAPPEMQDEAARRLQARSGWGQWPVCSRRIGAR